MKWKKLMRQQKKFEMTFSNLKEDTFLYERMILAQYVMSMLWLDHSIFLCAHTGTKYTIFETPRQ